MTFNFVAWLKMRQHTECMKLNVGETPRPTSVSPDDVRTVVDDLLRERAEFERKPKPIKTAVIHPDAPARVIIEEEAEVLGLKVVTSIHVPIDKIYVLDPAALEALTPVDLNLYPKDYVPWQ